MTETSFGRPIHLGLGSNINPVENIENCLNSLRQLGELRESQIISTPAEGFDGPPFLNLAVELQWHGRLEELKVVLERLEFESGRTAQHRGFASRTLDIDILLDGKSVAYYGDKPWRVPHPDISQYVHVAGPLAELVGDAVHPLSGEAFSSIARRLNANCSVSA